MLVIFCTSESVALINANVAKVFTETTAQKNEELRTEFDGAFCKTIQTSLDFNFLAKQGKSIEKMIRE